MWKWIAFSLAAIVAWRVYKSANAQFTGFVSSGWSGANARGNVPALVNPNAIVGALANGSPAVPYNFGSNWTPPGAAS
jgi:hypothetical protein